MNMQDYREQIDRIDAQLLDLFAKRMEVARLIGEYKEANGLAVRDPERERQKILSVLDNTPEELREYTPLLFSVLFELSRSYQYRNSEKKSELTEQIRNAIENTDKMLSDNPSVACQGVTGANSQAACEKFFRYPKIFFCSGFESVFQAVEKGLCRYGVIPLENSNAGSVNMVYDLMMKHHFYIVRSVRLKINHNLLALPGAKLSGIREIYSHEQAIQQSSAFLAGLKDVRVIPCENTATAAKMVAESGRTDIAALATERSRKQYGLISLADSVQNTDNNYTRFICISKNLEIYPGANRTSLMMTLPHEQGSLYRMLSRFYALGINLNKLESRPIPEREFEFMFYFDLDTPVYSPNLIKLIGELQETCEFFQYLGSYSEEV